MFEQIMLATTVGMLLAVHLRLDAFIGRLDASSKRLAIVSAAIRWVVMLPSGKNMPLDAAPSPKGTITVDDDGRARVDLLPGRAKFTSHFATCPNAAKHRRRR
jgi:hypothetical protein